MKKINFLIGLFMVASLALVFTSCKKDNSAVSETSASSDDAFAERIYDNVSIISDEAYSEKSSTLKSTDGRRLFLGDCVTITLDTVAVPHALIVDFGTENCLCNDGRYRRGQIIVSFTGRYRQPGTVITHTFNNYYVDDNHVEGTKVVTNMGFNEANHMYFQIDVVGVIHRANDGGTISWNSSITREWVEGLFTFTLWDDVYLISGTSSGIRANGETWQRTTITPLRKELGCKHFVSGILEITPGERPVRVLDYGDGECDNIATVTVNGQVFTIYLP
ncbi:MAG: hypothetical protein Q8O72_16830 [Bacteroidales bacterium]|nr:hypothetical protein [Bacteroidales bacterium]